VPIVTRFAQALRTALVAVLLAPLRLYRRVISPALPPRCRYYPTCSSYAEQAISEHGAVRGTALAAWRLARCNPFSRGGYDPVPAGRARTHAAHHDHGAAA
jgi:putative membrane protein insertion efficiency factor